MTVRHEAQRAGVGVRAVVAFVAPEIRSRTMARRPTGQAPPPTIAVVLLTPLLPSRYGSSAAQRILPPYDVFVQNGDAQSPVRDGVLLTAAQLRQKCLHRLRRDGEADVLSRG